LIKEALHLVKKLVREQVQQGLLQAQGPITQMEAHLTTEGQNLETQLEMGEILYQIHQAQASILLWTTLGEKELSLIWEADTSYLKP
jgi:hypothetical protein